ncbi:MAG TPA: hypothetical protein VLT61_05580 [Anaeromyxobacteraceae bacterium]|nr:hypothetical protein [Anaeromyxobacteraceae bacterium]
MGRLGRSLAACAALLLTSACGKDEKKTEPEPATPFLTQLQGSWLHCKTGATESTKDVLTFAELTVTMTSTSYTTGDCSGTGTPKGVRYGTIVIGAAVTANLGSAPVTANQIDVAFGSDPTWYQIAYVDAASTPKRLIFGDDTGAMDGTSAEKRPTVLSDVQVLEKTATVSAFEAQLQGSWGHCKTGATDSTNDVLTFSELRITVTSTSYATGDCSGTGTPNGEKSGTIAIGASVTANLGATPVTATQIDLSIGSDPTKYQIGWVDTASTPNRLHFGDDSGANDGTSAGKRPTVLSEVQVLERL